MYLNRNHHVLRSPEGEGEGGGAAVATAPAPAAPAPGPAAPTAPAAPAASAAPAPAATSAPAGTAAPAATSAPAASPAPTAAPKVEDTKAIWPDNWRETVSKDDAKKLTQLQRYASPQAMADALFAAQERIRSGELKPVLAKNATPEQLKEWRESHGIPETPDKYDLGKVQIADTDKPLMDVMFKALHGKNAPPEVVQTVAETWNHVKKVAMDAQAVRDGEIQQTSEDALRAEWGTEFRRNINLVHGLLDAVASPDLKDTLLQARLPDGTPFGSSPDIMRMLVSLALVQNPTGTVVPGGPGEKGEGIRGELEKLQKIPTAKKTEEQSKRQRELIDAAVKGGFMDSNGAWVAK